MIYIGIDNGTTGSIGMVSEIHQPQYFEMPIKKEQSYTKTKKNISRIDVPALTQILKDLMPCKVLIERPMVNPGRFQATASALRALEATVIVLEYLKLPYEYIDSKEWQHALLPKGLWKKSDKGKMKADPKELKKAAVDIARRLFPSINCKDADGLLIAEYLMRRDTGRI